jgi:signal transduction histidine kinase
MICWFGKTFPAWSRQRVHGKNAAEENSVPRVGSLYGQWSFWLVPTVYAGCLVAFIADLTSTSTLAPGVFYVPAVATAVFYHDKRVGWALCAIASGVVIVGSFSPGNDLNVPTSVWSRALSISAIVATTILIRHARSIQDQLVARVSRAEAAEHINAQVLANLNQEVLTRLYLMVDALELLARDSRGDDRTVALEIARTAGRHLIAAIDDLGNLT